MKYPKPRLENIAEKKLIGKRMTMSLSRNKTADLWKSFMPHRKEILSCTGTELYSLQVYSAMHFSNFMPDREFEKWAAIEVTGFNPIPENMEAFTLPAGLYAVFLYKGPSTDNRIFQYIFQDWLPASDYLLDNRPHFEILGEKYKNADPDSEEEIWIPVKPKKKPDRK